MNDQHRTEQELLEALYCNDSAAVDSHLGECEECGQNWRALQERRTELLSVEEDVPADFLAAQRRAIYQRMDKRSYTFSWPKWVPALAVALMLILGVFYFQPASSQFASNKWKSESDAQFFAEVTIAEQLAEPAAVAPLRGLFEE